VYYIYTISSMLSALTRTAYIKSQNIMKNSLKYLWHCLGSIFSKGKKSIFGSSQSKKHMWLSSDEDANYRRPLKARYFRVHQQNTLFMLEKVV